MSRNHRLMGYRITLDYCTDSSSKRHRPSYTVTTALELFDRLCRIKAQKLRYLYIEYQRPRFWSTRWGYQSEVMSNCAFHQTENTGRWIDLERWADLDYREQVAVRCWELMER